MTEFDYQWLNLPCPQVEYTKDRVDEFLKFTNIPAAWFKGKRCLDAGCGNGRYSYALKELGGIVDAFDPSEEAIKKLDIEGVRKWVGRIEDLKPNSYDFVLCWGVLHHTSDPKGNFDRLTTQLKKGGILHIMVYHEETEKFYYGLRKLFHCLTEENKVRLCEVLTTYTGSVHGWWDALNPQINYSYSVPQIREWFKDFSRVNLVTISNININAIK